MKVDIEKEYEKFIDNYDFNRDLSLRRTEKPHFARWAYGACKEWINDFEGSFKTWLENDFIESVDDEKRDLYAEIIRGKKEDLPVIKQRLKEKFNDDKILMRMLR